MLNSTEKSNYEKSLNVAYGGWINFMYKSLFTSDKDSLQFEPVKSLNSDTNLNLTLLQKYGFSRVRVTDSKEATAGLKPLSAQNELMSYFISFQSILRVHTSIQFL